MEVAICDLRAPPPLSTQGDGFKSRVLFARPAFVGRERGRARPLLLHMSLLALDGDALDAIIQMLGPLTSASMRMVCRSLSKNEYCRMQTPRWKILGYDRRFLHHCEVSRLSYAQADGSVKLYLMRVHTRLVAARWHGYHCSCAECSLSCALAAPPRWSMERRLRSDERERAIRDPFLPGSSSRFESCQFNVTPKCQRAVRDQVEDIPIADTNSPEVFAEYAHSGEQIPSGSFSEGMIVFRQPHGIDKMYLMQTGRLLPAVLKFRLGMNPLYFKKGKVGIRLRVSDAKRVKGGATKAFSVVSKRIMNEMRKLPYKNGCDFLTQLTSPT